MYSPRWLFLIPGSLLFCSVSWAMDCHARPDLWGMTFDAHTLLFASLGILCGYQSILFAIFTKAFAISEGLMPEDQAPDSVFRAWSISREGCSSHRRHCSLAIALLLAAVNQWRFVDFGDLEYARTMRLVVPGVTLTALGFQTVLSSFFVSILGMRRK